MINSKFSREALRSMVDMIVLVAQSVLDLLRGRVWKQRLKAKFPFSLLILW